MEAMAVREAVLVLAAYKLEGTLRVEVPCAGYEAWQELPPALEVMGTLCGKTGWSSDLCKAYYSSGALLGKAVML